MQAQTSAAAPLPGEQLTIDQTLRVMDIAREIRDKRETAEEMFRRDDLRLRLREKLMRTAELSGDQVTAAEIDVAIDHYLSKLHRFEEPERGWSTFLAHCWIRRGRILLGVVFGTFAAAGAAWLLWM